MSSATVWRWRQMETFQAYVNRLQRMARETLEAGMTALIEDAISTVSDVMRDGDTSAGDRLRAARYVLDTVRTFPTRPTDPRTLVRANVTAVETGANGDLMGLLAGDGIRAERVDARLDELGLNESEGI